MTLDELLEIAESESEEQKKITRRINVSVAAGCLSLHSDEVFNDSARGSEEARHGRSCKVKAVGCMGLCAAGPLVRTEPQHTYYRGFSPDSPEVSARLSTILMASRFPNSRSRPRFHSSLSKRESCWRTAARSIPNALKIILARVDTSLCSIAFEPIA